MTSPVEFPAAADAWPSWLQERIDTELTTARERIADLKDGRPRDAAAVLELWNDADIALRNADSLASLFSEVHPAESVRSLAEDRAQEISRVVTDRGLDPELYRVVAATDTPESPDAARLRERILRDFHRSGVDRDEPTRARLRAIAERTTVLDQDFGRAIRDDVRSIRIRPEQLDGLPPDYVAAHAADGDGLVTVTTDYPDVIPFRTFAHDADARRQLTVAFLNRAWPQNDATLAELLDLRAERAELLGYPSWPDYDAEVKMIGSGPAIMEFIDRLAAASQDAAERDHGVLLERARRDRPELTELTRADSIYYEELVRREEFDVDAQQVRTYFDFGRVRQGLLDTTGSAVRHRVLAARRRRPLARGRGRYDVVRDGQPIGRIYLDLHPREGKYKHAAQFDLVGGDRGAPAAGGRAGLQLLPRAHGAQRRGHPLPRVRPPDPPRARRQAALGRFSGVATEWDFVEAPSQMLEEWAWDPAVLGGFARDESGEAIPAALVRRMRAADDFGKGYIVRTQIFYAAVSYLLHRDRPADRTAAVRELQSRLRHVRPPGGDALPRRLRPPGRLQLGVLHVHVEPGDREGHVLRLRPGEPARPGGGRPLPRRGARARRRRGRRRPGRGVPGPAVLVRRVPGLAGHRAVAAGVTAAGAAPGTTAGGTPRRGGRRRRCRPNRCGGRS